MNCPVEWVGGWGPSLEIRRVGETALLAHSIEVTLHTYTHVWLMMTALL